MIDSDDGQPSPRVRCHLDDLLTARAMSLKELSSRAGISVANLAVLKNHRARAIRYSTLVAICDVLECQPGDLLSLD